MKKRCAVCSVKCTLAVRLAGTCRFCKKQFCLAHAPALERDDPRGHKCEAIEKARDRDLAELEKQNPGGGTFKKVATI
jgi:predicted nucleic acid binding AN1-type Zn finger protein